MSKIYLVRHGQDSDNANKILNGRRDKPLTKIGVNQAKKLTRKIIKSKIHFDYVYSSPLQRAYKTAEIITDSLKMNKPKKLKYLIERDFGVMTGKHHNMINKLCSPNIIQTKKICYFLKPEGAETFPMLIKRAEKLLSLLNKRHKNKNILLVTHGDFGKMIYAKYNNLEWKKALGLFHFGNSELLELSNKSDSNKTHIFKIKQHNI